MSSLEMSYFIVFLVLLSAHRFVDALHCYENAEADCHDDSLEHQVFCSALSFLSFFADDSQKCQEEIDVCAYMNFTIKKPEGDIDFRINGCGDLNITDKSAGCSTSKSNPQLEISRRYYETQFEAPIPEVELCFCDTDYCNSGLRLESKSGAVFISVVLFMLVSF